MFIVNISNQWNMNTFFDLAESKGVHFFRHSHTHQFTPNLFQAMNLGDGTFYVAGVGGTHRLYRNRRITTKGYLANMNLSCFSSHSSNHSIFEVPRNNDWDTSIAFLTPMQNIKER